MELHEATKSMVDLKYDMLKKINAAIQDFELKTALVVTGLHINISRRVMQVKFEKKYAPALGIDDIEIQLLEVEL